MTGDATEMSCVCAAKKDVAPLDELLPPILVRFQDQFGNDAAVPSDLNASDFTIAMDHDITQKYSVSFTCICPCVVYLCRSMWFLTLVKY